VLDNPVFLSLSVKPAPCKGGFSSSIGVNNSLPGHLRGGGGSQVFVGPDQKAVKIWERNIGIVIKAITC